MRISDWSSDVCSSDLEIFADEQQFRPRIAKDEADFGGRETAVDRCETGPRTRRPEKERIPAVMVFGQRRNAVTRRDVRSGQRVRDTVRPRVELSERSEEHTSELQSLMRISYAVFCLKKKRKNK